METAAIAEICQRRDIPWSVFRAISDRATDVSLDDEVLRLINRDGTFNFKMIGAFFVKHPSRLPALVRLAMDAKRAASTPPWRPSLRSRNLRALNPLDRKIPTDLDAGRSGRRRIQHKASGFAIYREERLAAAKCDRLNHQH